MLSETPHPVEASNTAAISVARIFVLFTGKSSARFQLECCQLLIFQAREMCGYYRNECARPMVTTQFVTEVRSRKAVPEKCIAALLKRLSASEKTCMNAGVEAHSRKCDG
jgi:hypothetical protein